MAQARLLCGGILALSFCIPHTTKTRSSGDSLQSPNEQSTSGISSGRGLPLRAASPLVGNLAMARRRTLHHSRVRWTCPPTTQGPTILYALVALIVPVGSILQESPSSIHSNFLCLRKSRPRFPRALGFRNLTTERFGCGDRRQNNSLLLPPAAAMREFSAAAISVRLSVKFKTTAGHVRPRNARASLLRRPPPPPLHRNTLALRPLRRNSTCYAQAPRITRLSPLEALCCCALIMVSVRLP